MKDGDGYSQEEQQVYRTFNNVNLGLLVFFNNQAIHKRNLDKLSFSIYILSCIQEIIEIYQK